MEDDDHARVREKKRFKKRYGLRPVRYGIWTGEEHLRQGEFLIKTQVALSVKNGDIVRKRKKKKHE